MTECYIFDAVRTPRGRGKAQSGSLAEMSPLGLARTVLRALAERSELGHPGGGRRDPGLCGARG